MSRVLAKMVQSGYGFFGEDTGTHARNAKRRGRGSHEAAKNAKRVIGVHTKPRRARRKGRVVSIQRLLLRFSRHSTTGFVGARSREEHEEKGGSGVGAPPLCAPVFSKGSWCGGRTPSYGSQALTRTGPIVSDVLIMAVPAGRLDTSLVSILPPRIDSSIFCFSTTHAKTIESPISLEKL